MSATVSAPPKWLSRVGAGDAGGVLVVDVACGTEAAGGGGGAVVHRDVAGAAAGIGKAVGEETGAGQADGEVVAAVAVEVSGRHRVPAGELGPLGEGAGVGGAWFLAVDADDVLLDDGQFVLAVTGEVTGGDVPAAGGALGGGFAGGRCFAETAGAPPASGATAATATARRTE
jgi:hypothetical protein